MGVVLLQLQKLASWPVTHIGAGGTSRALLSTYTAIFLRPERSWANLMKEDEWETCVKKDEFKRMIVGLLFFHANIQVIFNSSTDVVMLHHVFYLQ